MAAKVKIKRSTNYAQGTKINFAPSNNPVVSGFPKDLPNRTLVTRVTFKTPKTNGNGVRTIIRFKK